MAAIAPMKPEYDPQALAGALRALGMLYGASQPVEITIQGAKTEDEAIRTYIERERPHLLSCYELDALVRMVQAARETNAEARTSVEQFSPR